MNEQELWQAIAKYRFYHIIPLTEQVSTPGNPTYVPAQKLCMKYLKSLDLAGKRVLDIGCRDGLFSFAAESMGAAEVVGIDNDLSLPATEFLIPYFKSRVRMEQMNVYDLEPASFGLFDVVVFPGVLYHLRYPFWGLKAIRDVLKPGARLIVETAIYEGQPNNAMLFCPIGADSPYESTSPTFFNEKGLRDTLASLGFTTDAVEYCRPPESYPRVRALLRGLKAAVRTRLSWGSLAPIKVVTRCVFLTTFTGFDEGSFENRYWQGTHDFHSAHGG